MAIIAVKEWGHAMDSTAYTKRDILNSSTVQMNVEGTQCGALIGARDGPSISPIICIKKGAGDTALASSGLARSYWPKWPRE